MGNWIATSRTPVEKAGDLDDVKPPEGLTSLTKNERAQYDAAKKAASHLLPALDTPVHINLSGYASTDEPGRVQVTVAEADAE